MEEERGTDKGSIRDNGRLGNFLRWKKGRKYNITNRVEFQYRKYKHKTDKDRKKSVIPMSTEHRIQRFKSSYGAVSITATGATATATNILQQAVH